MQDGGQEGRGIQFPQADRAYTHHPCLAITCNIINSGKFLINLFHKSILLKHPSQQDPNPTEINSSIPED